MLQTSKKKNKNPTWQPGAVSAFTNQAENLSNFGSQGLNTGQIDLQNTTADARRKAAQTAQNIAAGAPKVAEGAQVTPTMAQNSAQPTIQPYQVTKEAPAAPNIDISVPDRIKETRNFADPTQNYLNNLYGQPPDPATLAHLQSALNQPIEFRYNPNTQDPLNSRHPTNDPNNITFAPNDSVSQSFENYISGLEALKNSSEVQKDYERTLGNQLENQLEGLTQDYNESESDIGQQGTEKNKLISDYIEKLNSVLKDYKEGSQGLSDISGLSEAEKAAEALNGVLSDPAVSNVNALSALQNTRSGNSAIDALTQQAQNAALQTAEGKARSAQTNEQTAAKEQANAQSLMNKSFQEAQDSVTKKRDDSLNSLKSSQDKGRQELVEEYNNSKSNLTNQEQNFVNDAQNILKKQKVPETAILNAAQAFSKSILNHIQKGNLPIQEKLNLKRNIEAIWRIAVGTHESDLGFSDKVAGYLIPIQEALDGYSRRGES